MSKRLSLAGLEDTSEGRPRLTALLSAEVSAQHARALPCSRKAERTMLGQAAGDVLRQWQKQWGINAVSAGEQTTTDLEVHCEPVTEMRDDVLFSALQWKPLNGGRVADDVWWAVAPLPVASGTQTERSPVDSTNRSRHGGLAVMNAISKALFGEAANLNRSVTRPNSTLQNPSSKTRPVREEPTTIIEASMAADVGFAAWIDWRDRLSQRFGLTTAAAMPEQAVGISKQILADFISPVTSDLPPHFLKNWSGALSLTMPLCGEALIFFIPGTLATDWLKHEMTTARAAQIERRSAAPAFVGANLIPLWKAVASQTADVEVELAPMEIDLGSLTALRVGDILRTSHALNMPLIVKVRSQHSETVAAAEALCGGFLGKKGEQRAVELLQ